MDNSFWGRSIAGFEITEEVQVYPNNQVQSSNSSLARREKGKIVSQFLLLLLVQRNAVTSFTEKHHHRSLSRGYLEQRDRSVSKRCRLFLIDSTPYRELRRRKDPPIHGEDFKMAVHLAGRRRMASGWKMR